MCVACNRNFLEELLQQVPLLQIHPVLHPGSSGMDPPVGVLIPRTVMCVKLVDFWQMSEEQAVGLNSAPFQRKCCTTFTAACFALE